MNNENEVEKIEEAMKVANEKIRFLEKKLRNQFLPKTKQRDIKRELNDKKKLLETNQIQLIQLQTRKRKSFAIAFFAGIFVFLLLIYLMYNLIDIFYLLWEYWNEDDNLNMHTIIRNQQ